ncbi:LOW QUALITY PROTEIN: uncharacterized protein NimA [Drosophila tropicalis]|uniref:LOW QUALITY PROTEIN: uncharacterized protein NimA n=1 Tax=Drosophila tropicalis TaxID=46794 RepID=UPI0035AB762C
MIISKYKFISEWSLLIFLLLPFRGFSQINGSNNNNNSNAFRINTNLKEIDATTLVLPSIQGQVQLQNIGTGPGNICIREEPYVEVVQVPEMQPVRVRSSSWCLEIPPRCATYKTEMREVMKVQRLNKTRTVRFCCQGYEGNLSDSQATCKPICRGGCGRGSCVMPDICSCEEGYTGKHCTQRCDHDRWGLDCRNPCQCQNGAVCDNKTGLCHCTAGWAGQFCEQTCPAGTYGVMCRKACDCGDNISCHPQTGSCLIQEHSVPLNVSHVIVETVNSTLEKMGIIPRPAIPAPLPEVILIKQPSQDDGQHTPKIIVHQSLENLHAATAAGTVPASDVIHVITNAAASPQEHLAGFVTGETTSPGKSSSDHESGLLTMLIVIVLLLLTALTLGTLYVFRRYHHKEAIVYNANGTVTTQSSNPEVVLTEAAALGKNFQEPLPQPPNGPVAILETNEVELYDTPSNNSSIKTPPYAYARKESLYSVVSPKSRKGSLDSHLYDEIRYHQQQQQQQQQRQQHHFQHSTTAAAYLPPAQQSSAIMQSNGHSIGHLGHHQSHHHVSHLIIPPQNSNFLQVPTHITAKKIAHL